jgi:hypothetical protein
MSSDATDVSGVPASVFQDKYDEYTSDLLEVFPDFEAQIRTAIALSPNERLTRFQREIRVVGVQPSANHSANPGTILPGLTIDDAVWAQLSDATRGAIWEYLQLLSMCCFLEHGFASTAPMGGAGGEAPAESDPGMRSWIDGMMGQWREKLSGVDFEGLMGKFSSIFGGGETTDGSGNAGFKMPELPQKFLKGHLAKLAEEIVRDIRPEDLGLTQEMMEECERSPSRALNMLVQVFTRNPGMIQATIKKIGNRLQQKVQSGQIRPQEIAREAEELMHEFSNNPEFVGVMESLKGMFGFEDMDFARSAGREGSARLSMVQQRLRAKLAARKAAAEGAATGGGGGGEGGDGDAPSGGAGGSSTASRGAGARGGRGGRGGRRR